MPDQPVRFKVRSRFFLSKIHEKRMKQRLSLGRVKLAVREWVLRAQTDLEARVWAAAARHTFAEVRLRRTSHESG